MSTSCGFELSPSHMAVKALGFALPALPTSPQDVPCGLCGFPLRTGTTPAKPFTPSQEFGSFELLHPARSTLICAACDVVLSTKSGFLSRFSRAVFTEQAAYRLTSAEDIGWMLLRADPPFVAVYNTRASAHVIWQAPVTFDVHAIGVVVGPNVFSVNRTALLRAHAALGRLAVAGNEILGAHYQWPIFNLTLQDDLVDVCRLIPSHERVLRACSDNQVEEDLKVFDGLSLGERWGLAAMLLARPKRALPIDDFRPPPRLSRIPLSQNKAQR